MSSGLRRARVRVPCSTSNLGAGFDCIGLAFQRYLTIEFRAEPNAAPNTLLVEAHGTAHGIATDDDLVTRTLVAELQRLGVELPSCTLHVDSDIPLRRGLGSSAAATVGGLLLAHVIAGDSNPDRNEVLQIAATREGHPDNVAPALLGGLVGIARDEEQRFKAFRLPLSDRIGFAFAAPDAEVETPLARKALPDAVPHAMAVRSVGRMAALTNGLAQADPELLRIGFHDELHVPYRLPLIPRGAAALAAALVAGAWAVTISGSGSGLVAACARGREDEVANAMAAALQEAGSSDHACYFAAVPDLSGATIEIES